MTVKCGSKLPICCGQNPSKWDGPAAAATAEEFFIELLKSAEACRPPQATGSMYSGMKPSVHFQVSLTEP